MSSTDTFETFDFIAPTKHWHALDDGRVGQPDPQVRAVGGVQALQAQHPAPVLQLEHPGGAGGGVLVGDELATGKLDRSGRRRRGALRGRP